MASASWRKRRRSTDVFKWPRFLWQSAPGRTQQSVDHSSRSGFSILGEAPRPYQSPVAYADQWESPFTLPDLLPTCSPSQLRSLICHRCICIGAVLVACGEFSHDHCSRHLDADRGTTSFGCFFSSCRTKGMLVQRFKTERTEPPRR